MTDVINFLIMSIIVVGLIVALTLLLALGYWIAWTGAYIPINKKLKYDEALEERNREYNKIKVDVEEIIDLKESKKIEYQIEVIKMHELAEEIKKTEAELQRKQELNKQYEERLKLLDNFMNSPEGKLFISSQMIKQEVKQSSDGSKSGTKKQKKEQKDLPLETA